MKRQYINQILIVIFVLFVARVVASAAELEKKSVDYEGLAQSVEIKNIRKDCNGVVKLLNPHKDDSKNKSGNFYNMLGLAYRFCNDLNSAESVYKKGIKADPQNAFLHNNLGVIHRKNKDYNNSLKEFEIAISLDPNEPAYSSGLARTKVDIGKKLIKNGAYDTAKKNFEKALTFYELSLKLNPPDFLSIRINREVQSIKKKYLPQISKLKIYKDF